MAATNGRPRRRRGRGRPTTPVWPDDEPGLPPLDGIVPALAGFEGIGDASPLDIEVRVSAFLGELGAGAPPPDDPDEPSHEQLVNGLVEVCLHHLEESPPRVVIDFLWVVDAFGLGYLEWPLHDRLESSALPSAPAWAVTVGGASVTGTHLVTHEMGDGFDVVITARHPGADADHVVAVYVDANLDGLAKDLLVHHDAEEFLRLSSDAPGMRVEEIDPATAAAMIDEAVDTTFETGALAPVAEEFASLYSVVDHYVAKLPSGGALPPPREPASPADQEQVVDRFLSTAAGRGHSELRPVLLDAVEFVVDELGGDPLRWTPVVTQLVVVGWLPLSLHGTDALDGFVALLRDFVPWSHQQKGWSDRYVADAVAVLDAAVADPTTTDAVGRVEVLDRAVEAGIDLDDEAALDAFLDEYLDG